MAEARTLPLVRVSPRDFLAALATTFALGACAFLVVKLFAVAGMLRIDYYDAYQNFLNARGLAERSPAFYNPYRPFGASLLFLPCHLFDRMAWASCHRFAVAIFATFGITAFAFFRRKLSTPLAAAATMVLLYSPLALHFAPFGKEDIPATLFLTLSLFLHFRGARLATILAVTAAASVRYPLVVFLPVFYACDLAARRSWRAALAMLVTPPLLLLAVSAAVYSVLGRPPLALVGELFEGYRFNAATAPRPAWLAPLFAYHVAGPLVLVAATLGARRDRRVAAFAVAFLAFSAFVIPGKEARYFVPLLPPLIYLAALGMQTVWEWIPNRVVHLYLLALVLIPLANGARELARFDDPVYADDFVARVSAALAARSPAGNLYWIGPFYPLHPKHFIDHPLDDYTHLHHISADALIWQLDRPVRGLPVDLVSRVVREGDAVVVNREPHSYVGRTVPNRALQPVVVEAVRGGVFADATIIQP